MIIQARREVKARKTTRTPRVTFDATTHRNRRSPSFAAGLVEPTRWRGEHRYAPWTAEDIAWAEEIFLIHRASELDAEEQAYNEMLDQMAFEEAAVSRLSRGHCL